MKPKIAPTSPKARLTDETLTDLYRDQGLVKPPRPPRQWWIIVVALVCGLLAGAVSPWGLAQLADRYPALGWLTRLRLSPVGEKVIIRETPVKSTEERPTTVQEQLRPTLVTIYADHGTADIPTAAYAPTQARGYGVVGTSDGIIVTTSDVIPDDNGTFVVARSDGTVATVTSVVRDSLTPYVFLRTVADHLAAAKFANTLPTASGTPVRLLRTGAPRAVSELWPASLVDSASLAVQDKDDWLESTENYRRVITVSPAPPKGWSGAALLDEEDNVLGIWSESRGGAIPITTVASHVASLTNDETLPRLDLGLQSIDLSLRLGLPAALRKGLGEHGALVDSVRTKSSSSTAGLRPGDVITKVDTVNLDATHHLTLLLQAKKAETIVSLTVLRGSETRTLPLKLTAAQ
jgi:S1-C subfamily serine protease